MPEIRYAKVPSDCLSYEQGMTQTDSRTNHTDPQKQPGDYSPTHPMPDELQKHDTQTRPTGKQPPKPTPIQETASPRYEVIESILLRLVTDMASDSEHVITRTTALDNVCDSATAAVAMSGCIDHLMSASTDRLHRIIADPGIIHRAHPPESTRRRRRARPHHSMPQSPSYMLSNVREIATHIYNTHCPHSKRMRTHAMNSEHHQDITMAHTPQIPPVTGKRARTEGTQYGHTDDQHMAGTSHTHLTFTRENAHPTDRTDPFDNVFDEIDDDPTLSAAAEWDEPPDELEMWTTPSATPEHSDNEDSGQDDAPDKETDVADDPYNRTRGRLPQYVYTPPPQPKEHEDSAVPIGLIAVSSLRTQNLTPVLFIDEIYVTESGKGVARSLIAHAINHDPAATELHLITRSDAAQQEKARRLFDDIQANVSELQHTYALNPDYSTMTPLRTHEDTDMLEEYRIGTRSDVRSEMSISYWQQPIITQCMPREMNAQTLNLLNTIGTHHMTANGGDGSDIYDILGKAGKIYIAYEDPRQPMAREVISKHMIHDPPTDPKPMASTPVRTREMIQKLSLSDNSYTAGRAAREDPSILHRVHTMNRSELEYVIEFAITCKKRQVTRITHNPDKPAARRAITSRWTKRSIDAYTSHLMASHTSIT